MEWMEKLEKGVKDFFKEGRVAIQVVAKEVVVLEGVEEEILQYRKPRRLVEVVEGTQGEAEAAMIMIPAEEEEDHITMEKIIKMNAVTIQLGMATRSLHYCKILQLLLYSPIFMSLIEFYFTNVKVAALIACLCLIY